MNIILCGYMGSGKSRIGKLFAKTKAMKCLDLDSEISDREGLSIPEIFKHKGEIYFRKAEIETLKHRLDNLENTVLTLGGGTPCYGHNLELIKKDPDSILVYLKVKLDVLTNRLFHERHQRPLIRDISEKDQLKDFIRKHLFERRFYYEQSAITINCSSRSPGEVVETLEKELRNSKRG